MIVKSSTLLLFIIPLLISCSGQHIKPTVDMTGVDLRKYETDLRECQSKVSEKSNKRGLALLFILLSAAAESSQQRMDKSSGTYSYREPVCGYDGKTCDGISDTFSGNDIEIVSNCLTERGYKVIDSQSISQKSVPEQINHKYPSESARISGDTLPKVSASDQVIMTKNELYILSKDLDMAYVQKVIRQASER